jgi:hypothetical protein
MSGISNELVLHFQRYSNCCFVLNLQLLTYFTNPFSINALKNNIRETEEKSSYFHTSSTMKVKHKNDNTLESIFAVLSSIQFILTARYNQK